MTELNDSPYNSPKKPYTDLNIDRTAYTRQQLRVKRIKYDTVLIARSGSFLGRWFILYRPANHPHALLVPRVYEAQHPLSYLNLIKYPTILLSATHTSATSFLWLFLPPSVAPSCFPFPKLRGRPPLIQTTVSVGLYKVAFSLF